jgi:AcrR family transcriptional regulator
MATTVRLPRAERRTQLIEAAATGFLRGGFDGTSMEDVAREAGVTRLIVYRIFESKLELYQAVLDTVLDDMAAGFSERDAVLLAGDPVETSRTSIPGLVLASARRHPDAFRLLWRHAAHEPEFAATAALFSSVVVSIADDLLRPAVADEQLRSWAARAAVGHLFDGICGWLDTGRADRDDEFVVLLTGGLRAMVAAWSR